MKIYRIIMFILLVLFGAIVGFDGISSGDDTKLIIGVFLLLLARLEIIDIKIQ